jgi:hypothetical protein
MIVSMSAPPEAGIDNLTRRLDSIKGLEDFREHGHVLFNLEGLPQRMAERPAQEDGPRRLYLLGILPYDRYAYRRDARLLDHALYQADGLIADASSGCEQDRVHTVGLQPLRNFRSLHFD